jgi:hypothetical protein
MLDLTPVLRLYGRFRRRRLARISAAESQARVLRRLCGRAKATRFGSDHGFASVRSVADFQARTPLRGYREFWSGYWQERFPVLADCTWPGTVPYFALTSGTTTGATKYIPYTAEMARDAYLGMLELFTHHLAHRPESRVFGGKGLMLSGEIDLKEQAPGIYSGAVSGITAQRVPRWLQPRVLPSREIAAMHDWSEKIARLAKASLGEDVRVLGGSPNWLLLFIDQLARLTPGERERLVTWYRNLELIVHGGVNFAPYRARFHELLEGSRAETREAYSASEGFFAAADRGDGEGMRLIADRGIFYEFVPADEIDSPNPTRHWAATVEPGVEYALYVSTCAGAWAYGLGDTVRLVDTEPLRLVVTGRTSYLLSVFGEHVIEEELAQAVTEAAGALGTGIADYSVSPVMGGEGQPRGGHHYIVECARAVTEPSEIEAFTERLDACLQVLNDDYRELRHRDAGLLPPVVQFAPPGSFAAWMKRRGRAGGQNKVPRIIHDAALFEDLRSFMASAAAAEAE